MAEQKPETGKWIFFFVLMAGLGLPAMLLDSPAESHDTTEAEPRQYSEYELETMMVGCMLRYREDLLRLRDQAIPGWFTIDRFRDLIHLPVTDPEVQLARVKCCEPEGLDPETCKLSTQAHVRQLAITRFKRFYPGKPIYSPRELELAAQRGVTLPSR